MTTDERHPDDVEHDIDQTRARIDRNVDELQERLSPGGLVDEAAHYLRGSGDTVKRNLGTVGSNIGRTVKDNPVPAILICAGLAWLAVDAARSRSSSSDDDDGNRGYDRRAGQPMSRDGDDYGAVEQGRYPMGTARGAVMGDAMPGGNDDESGKSKIGEKAGRVGERVEEGAARVMDSARESAGMVGDRVHAARQRAGEVGVQAKDKAVDVFDRQPLLVGVLGLAVGAAIALALPNTRREDKVLGPYRDDLRERVTDYGRDQVEKAERVADAAVTAARDKLSGDGENMADRLTDKIGDAAKAATKAAKDEAKKSPDSKAAV